MRLALAFLAGWAIAAQEPADVPSLEERVRTLRTGNLFDAAQETLKKFAAAHPALAEDSRFQRLDKATREIAREADRLFQERMAEARGHFDGERYAQAVEAAGRALQIYPERDALVTPLQARARDRMASHGMIRIPSQPCWIGSDERPEERPFRKVILPAFLIDRYPVTVAEYAVFVTSTGAAAPSGWAGGRPPRGQERHPVVGVTWGQAAAYAAWIGKRLLTAEEWEVAARGTDRREFPWGAAFQEREDRFPCNSVEYWQVNKTKSPGTTPVDQFPFQAERGAFGVSLGGNVWEWTSTKVAGSVAGKPAEFRILKGGSFMTPAKSLRCAAVLAENPALSHPDVGFRCAKDAP